MTTAKPLFSALPAAALTLAALAAGPAAAQSRDAGMHVTKSPTCGCCEAWVALAREAGYTVETTETRDVTAPKLEAGIPGDLWACHTATIEGYVVEGHVPFAAVERLLAEGPDLDGIAVPGMPAGSPGMGHDPAARYDVVAFGGTAGGEGEVFFRAGRD